MKMQDVITPVTEIVCDLGEGPLWSGAEQALYWHDVTGRLLHRLDTSSGEVTTRPLPAMPGSFAFRRGGGMIAAFRNRLALVDVDGAIVSKIGGHDIDFGAERFNDGACDAAGRFWAGTFDPSLKRVGGSLYRIDPDLSVHRMDTGIAMSNGIAWSPDGTAMYYVDSRPGCVYRYDCDPGDGGIGERRVFLDYEGREGRPDGCAVDSEGYLWVAEVTAWRVSRYAPDGRLDRSIRLPVGKPTSLAFGSSDLKTLYVTSMRYGLSEAEQEAQPLAGRLLAVAVDVAGQPEHPFGG